MQGGGIVGIVSDSTSLGWTLIRGSMIGSRRPIRRETRIRFVRGFVGNDGSLGRWSAARFPVLQESGRNGGDGYIRLDT